MLRPVTIIGGGLAGLTLGIGLRQRGVAVTIHESGDYPRHRVCGEFISGRGQTVLGRLGLLADFEKAGAVYAQTAIFISGTAKSPVRKLIVPALCLSRYEMDSLLAAKFRELGGELLLRSRANPNNREEGVVFATGRRLAPTGNEIRWFGVKAHASISSTADMEADLEMHLSPDGYVGLNRINHDRLNVCGLFRARADKQRPDSKIDWLLGQPDSRLRGRLKNAQFDPQSFCSVGGIQLKRMRARARDECCIGDALTMTPPVTGNGMSMAFESGEIALEPIAAYSRGEINWMEAKRQIASKCDAAFNQRLAWAQMLQWMMVAKPLQGALGKFLLRSSWLWQFMFARTR
jgi:2-polyprenyl-6-methoxyphenol hydroxylase-like FAD-dependent oxidoreductase